MSVSYHGEPDYLYETADRGKSWRAVHPAKTDDSCYFDGFAPVFFDESATEGMLLLKRVGRTTDYPLYKTRDGGAHWQLLGTLDAADITGVSFYPGGGYAVDATGALWEISGL